MRILGGLQILWQRLTKQGPKVTAWWAADHAVRIVTGAPIRMVSEIQPHLHVGGQYRRRGWRRLETRGITAVLNVRIEVDDRQLGIAPDRYLQLLVEDDHAPSLEQLRKGVDFISAEAERGGSVYVHCGSGIGRAATMAAAYLVSTGLTEQDAWACIRAVRPFIRPTPVQLEQLHRFAAQA